MSTLYLDLLNDDLMLLLLSKLDYIADIVSSSYRIRRLTQNDANCRTIFKYKNLDLYNFIITLKNITFQPDWPRLLNYNKFWEPFKPTIETLIARVPAEEGYLSDILWSYHLHIDFPKFYEEIKYINLDHRGASNFEFHWKDVYIWCDELKHFDFMKGDFTRRNYNKLIITFQQSYDDAISKDPIAAFKMLLFDATCIPILFKYNSGRTVSIEYLYTMFLVSSDIHFSIVTSQNLIVKIHPDSLRCMRSLYPKAFVLESFLSDIRERLGIVIS
jgi:hypothetical protein